MDSVIATIIFWLAFAFSAGPFWIALMEAAPHSTFAYLYRNYITYLVVGWAPIVLIIGTTVGFIGHINENIFDALYFLGSGAIFYLAYKALTAKVQKKKFDFNWKTMAIVSWLNPKVWLTIPAGALSANYTDNIFLNSFLLFLISVPIFLFGVYFWAMIGRAGVKMIAHRFTYFNTSLLIGYGIYLLYQGIEKFI